MNYIKIAKGLKYFLRVYVIVCVGYGLLSLYIVEDAIMSLMICTVFVLLIPLLSFAFVEDIVKGLES